MGHRGLHMARRGEGGRHRRHRSIPSSPKRRNKDLRRVFVARRSLGATAACRLPGGVAQRAALSPHFLNNSHAT